VNAEAHQKVRPRHLKRAAYLYVRQSTLRQVFENTESTKRQYDLRQRAVALGWPVEQIIVIDTDLGQSGASAADREGFQRLVTEVGLARAGIVMGLEVSRLARNSSDWHRLLEICALTDTLILDEDGVYDPAHFNDRLLLGLKGTMSEAELHVLRARLRGGILNKARRGELETPLPVGFVYSGGRVVLDPDVQVQESLRAFFRIFRETGSATSTVRAFRQRGLRFPCHPIRARNEVVWHTLQHSRALEILHNPRYAGVFCFGRTRQRKLADGRVRSELLPRDEWTALIRSAHEGYITWEEFEENERRLRENTCALAKDRIRTPPREGTALLQGLVICGVCGNRMTVRYHRQGEALYPDYLCQRAGIQHAERSCQVITGAPIDQKVGEVLVEAMTPMAMEVALLVQTEIQARIEDADRLRARQVERARYEADLARRRYVQVDPGNRLVADVLEADWNMKLRALADAQSEYEARRQADRVLLTDEQRDGVRALAVDFPAVWRDPRTSNRERKRMLRLLIEDVTLVRRSQITVHIRFRGGTTRTITVPPPLPAWALRQTSAELVAEIDRMLDDHTDIEIAAILNARGYVSGEGKPLHRLIIRRIRLVYSLRSRRERLRAAGMLTIPEIAARLGVHPSTVKVWRREGYLHGHAFDDRGQCLYEPPGPDAPLKYKWKKRGPNALRSEPTIDRTEEVQYEA
jgi:DNA invertase Pin-like site-specific DNA recombinase